MSVARVTEITSESTKSFEDAIRQGIARASSTLEQIKSAWVKEQTVLIENGELSRFRVDMKVTFVLKE